MSRLFWFALGGASAFWWVRKHDEEKFARFSGKIGGEEGRNGWNCMKHSWGRRAELQDRQRDALAENQIDKDVELWKQETKEKVCSTLIVWITFSNITFIAIPRCRNRS